MIAERTLRAALDRGILTVPQAEALRVLEAELDAAAPAVPISHDDERLRFITGFGDIFVTIGLGLFLTALSYFADRTLSLPAGWAAIAAASWLLAEYFTRRRRMALPSIVLLIVFAGSVMAAASLLLTGSTGGWLFGFANAPHGLELAGAGVATLAAVTLHYARFHVPITIAAGAAALVAIIVGLAGALIPALAEGPSPLLLILCGLGVFALAMAFDMSDPHRETRRTDIAFWLHLLAAPLIVHPLFNGLTGDASSGGVPVWPVLIAFLLLGAVAVLIDRRALLVSGLVYAGYAFGALVRSSGLTGLETPLTLLVLGGFVLLLSAAWHPLRRAVLSVLPPGLAGRLPRP
ncbi:hypothetical protein MWN34_11210 [Ancylobacter sp. 6x-1]|uniref:DUF2157 domain-containing protein n=1 Tax=Ancylobacter crimeensis TaxID=2579147 RepID=A0ABT0DBZ7_9HYPH|nr:hypothetical protein [Ancylobacter crimeensis]MCK0197483.1 hypothetical protein [Ancylobacter crimeensis]